jgi:hypothetical protein
MQITEGAANNPSSLNDDNRINTFLEINVKQKRIIEYIIESGERRNFSFSSLKQVEKSPQNYKLLKLLFEQR